MIGEIDPRAYDCEGRQTLLPDKKSLHFRPTHVMGSYLGGELTVSCDGLADVQRFLRSCRYVSDPEQFGVRDYWSHPRDFERSRQGDCDCFALWTWRQLLEMGYPARFVLGRVGYGRWFHAWVTFSEGGTHYLVEATAARRKRLSRMTTLMYEPVISVGYEDGRLIYRQHRERDYRPTPVETVAIVAEWVPLFLLRRVRSLLMLPWHLLQRRLRGRDA